MLREIPEEGVKELLSKKDALAACDVAVFVHDRYLIYFFSNFINCPEWNAMDE